MLDLGGGTGTLGRALHPYGVHTVVIDRAEHLVQAPPPRVRADLGALACAAWLWVLDHLPEPVVSLREAARVLRPGGGFVAATSAPTTARPGRRGTLPAGPGSVSG